MTTSIPRDEIRFDARFAELPAILDLLRTACAKSGLCANATRHAELVIEEAFANSIRHGYGGESDRNAVWLAFEAISGGARIVYQDAAPPFDPLLAASLPADDRIGGRGCLLIKTLPQRAEYRRTAGRNILSFDFRPRN